MFLIENGKINYDIEIEITALPKNYEDEIKTFPLISRYADFCRIQLKFLSGSKTMDILNAVSQFAHLVHNTGHVVHDMCLIPQFSVAFDGMQNEVKEKLKNLDLRKLHEFFGVSQEDLIAEYKEALKGALSGIGGLFKN